MPEQNVHALPPRIKLPGQRYGPDNNWWKGGRVIASNGYVLILVGKEHHLADVRGYAYEHRIVLERKLGRRLRPGEMAHHINGNKQDNREENLEVKASNAEHFLEHRKPGSNLRMPDEPNPVIECRCGCGELFDKYDTTGRPRQYVSGHNPIPAPAMMAVAAVLAGGPTHRNEIARQTDVSVKVVAACLSKMKHRGLVIKKGGGIWQLRQ